MTTAFIPMRPLHTERLTLRPLTLADQHDIFAYASNTALCKNIPWETHQTLEDTKHYIHRLLAADNHMTWGITISEENRVIGTIHLTNYTTLHHRAQLRFLLSEQYWAQGIMVEAGQAVVQFAFEQLNVQKIIAECFIEHHRTHRVLQKLGMGLEGIAKKHIWLNGRYHDVILYALFQHEGAS